MERGDSNWIWATIINQIDIIARNIRRRGGGERLAEEVSVLMEGDLNSQYAKSAFPSYSRIDFADIFFNGMYQ